MKNIYLAFLSAVFLSLILFLSGCAGNKDADEKEIKPKTLVTYTNISKEQLSETVDLNATSVFQIKDNVKSNLSGYIQEVHVKLGDFVKKGQILFALKTKEASALSNRSGDTTFNFAGVVKVYSPLNGVIISMNKQNGDYVQEGDDLAIIAEQNSLVFILDVPFELRNIIKTGSTCNINLPGDEIIKGTITSAMPTVDATSQSQSYIVKPNETSSIPENLIAKINIEKSNKRQAMTLPKEAVLANETQTEFWIMKLINDSIVVKVPITKGIESSGKIEILDPSFSSTDRIIISGNYGLPDTASVLINKSK